MVNESTVRNLLQPLRAAQAPGASTARGHMYLAQSTPVPVVVRARRTPQCPPLRYTSPAISQTAKRRNFGFIDPTNRGQSLFSVPLFSLVFSLSYRLGSRLRLGVTVQKFRYITTNRRDVERQKVPKMMREKKKKTGFHSGLVGRKMSRAPVARMASVTRLSRC